MLKNTTKEVYYSKEINLRCEESVYIFFILIQRDRILIKYRGNL
jgi:hypothetical protein